MDVTRNSIVNELVIAVKLENSKPKNNFLDRGKFVLRKLIKISQF